VLFKMEKLEEERERVRGSPRKEEKRKVRQTPW
jgi:hypothetical protein